jgi:hypothetical protein
MTPEGKTKDRIKAVLKRRQGLHYDMPVPSGYGKRTIDFIGCFRGLYFGIEAKAGLGTPTAGQAAIMARITEAGGVAFHVNDDPNSLLALIQWLDRVEQGHVHLKAASGHRGAV